MTGSNIRGQDSRPIPQPPLVTKEEAIKIHKGIVTATLAETKNPGTFQYCLDRIMEYKDLPTTKTPAEVSS